jgi:hypothetical protein
MDKYRQALLHTLQQPVLTLLVSHSNEAIALHGHTCSREVGVLLVTLVSCMLPITHVHSTVPVERDLLGGGVKVGARVGEAAQQPADLQQQRLLVSTIMKVGDSKRSYSSAQKRELKEGVDVWSATPEEGHHVSLSYKFTWNTPH